MLKVSKLVLLAGLIAVSIISNANADELKIGYVNIERVFRKAPAAITAGKKMDQEFEGRKQELQRTADDIKSRQAALLEKGSSLSDSQRRTKEAELSDISVRFQRSQQAFQEDIKNRKNAETSALLEKANKAIIEIAKSEQFDIIFQDAIAVSTRLDLTDKVIRKLATE